MNSARNAAKGVDATALPVRCTFQYRSARVCASEEQKSRMHGVHIEIKCAPSVGLFLLHLEQKR